MAARPHGPPPTTREAIPPSSMAPLAPFLLFKSCSTFCTLQSTQDDISLPSLPSSPWAPLFPPLAGQTAKSWWRDCGRPAHTAPRAPGGLRPNPAPPLRLPNFFPFPQLRGRGREGPEGGGGARPPLPRGGRPPRSLHWPERAAGAGADVRRARVRRAQRRPPSSPGSGGGAPSGGGGQHAARLRLGLPHPRRPRPRQQRRRRRSSERRPRLQRRRVRARGAAAGIGAGDPAWRCGGAAAAAGRPGCSCCSCC